ncbi:hypothetical protein [Aureimonas psammosilenae]|uniref:hypothetical protein n=1 Tax=Aureimonas psammosilenae TaxID=2495496 RepID=UPI001260E931|nr:hypothetical protein [Aureimonas psammosilenae]
MSGQPGLVVQIQRSAVDPDRAEEPNWWVVDEFRFTEATDLRSERYTVCSQGWWRVVAFLDGDSTDFTKTAGIQICAGRVTDETDDYQKRRRQTTVLETTIKLADGQYSLRRSLPYEEFDHFEFDPPPGSGFKFNARELARNQFGAEALNASGGKPVAISEFRSYNFTSRPPTTYVFGASA